MANSFCFQPRHGLGLLLCLFRAETSHMGFIIEVVANGAHDQLLLQQGEADYCLLGHLFDFMAR